MSGVLSRIAEFLRINAVRRMLRTMPITRGEVASLVAFAVVFALFEGVGISLLLPVLQFAESQSSAITDSGSPLWVGIRWFVDAIGLPINLATLLAMAFVPILLRQAVFYLNNWWSAIVAKRVTLRMRRRVVEATMDADPSFFARFSPGHIYNIIMGQATLAGQAVLAVIKLLSIAMLLAVYASILLVLSVPLTLIAIGFALIVSIVVRTAIRQSKEFGVEAARTSQTLASRMVERLSLIRLVKMRAREADETERIMALSDDIAELGVKQVRLGGTIEVTADPLLMLSVFVTLYIGMSALGMTLAQLGLVLFVLTRLNAKVKEFNAARQAISSAMAGVILVEEFIGQAEAADTIRGGDRPFGSLETGISVRDVSYSYPGADEDAPPMLQGVSLEIPARSLTAIVGRSGAGKSTFVELLPRFRDPSSGSIVFDGVDAREYDLATLRRGVGYLTQTPLLFNDTVYTNLVYGLDRSVTDAEIRDALESSSALFAYDLPQGLNTVLGDAGVRLSGGERQRLALARTLLSNASVIILDEPTSALDSESESLIQEALDRLRTERTIIVIAHRLATVIAADKLFVIDGGQVVEEGTHSELLERDGVYRRLFDSQLIRA